MAPNSDNDIQKHPPEVSCEKDLLRNFAKFTGKYPYQSLFFDKVTLTHVFSCEFCKISKNTFFTEYLWETASGYFPFVKQYFELFYLYDILL